MILLSFDIEEFDMPFEYGKTISFDEQIAISKQGTEEILNILNRQQVKATFFCTAVFALAVPQLVKRMVDEGHELASHGYYHSDFKTEHLRQSKLVLEEIGDTTVTGFRMARMKPVNPRQLREAGYLYNSSLNPTYLPGRYNNFKKPRTVFTEEGLVQLPASVSPRLRIPLFWLSFHNFPLAVYRYLSMQTHKKDGYLNIYFHPWEFTNLTDKERFGFPAYVRRNTGKHMAARLERLITFFKQRNIPFGTIGNQVLKLPAKNQLHVISSDE